jgi:mono/diheme cytochrome c family protein
MRWVVRGIAGLVVLLLVAVAAIWLLSERALNAKVAGRPSHLATPSAVQLADGDRMLRTLGCANCHAEGLQGKKFIDIPGVATIHTPNLTMVAAKASDAQLDRAIRQGIGHDGTALHIMPSQEYQFLTDEETAALIAAIRRVPRGGQEQPANQLSLKGRLGVLMGKFQNAPTLVAAYAKQPLPDLGPQTAAGRHLVQTSCSECHGADLKGREIEPGTVSADLAIAGAYDLPQFRTLLKTGVAPGNKQLGLMGDVARKDFSHLRDDEIAAIHAYLVAYAQR